MAEFKLKNGNGSLFKVENRTDKHPLYRGSFKGLDGNMYDIALWPSKSEKVAFNVSIQLPYVKQVPESTPIPNENLNEPGADLPF